MITSETEDCDEFREYDLIDMTHSYNVTKNEITEYLWYMETLY